MTKGDIILVPFPFTDLTGNKTRPALVLYKGSKDVTVAFISTQTSLAEPTDIILEPTNLNGLKRISVLRVSKIATLDIDIVLGKLGELSKDQIGDVDKSLRVLLQI